jgi:lysophospholipase L1-like esterase
MKEIHTKCPQTKVYVQSILPINSTLPHFPQHYDKQEHILAVNKLLKTNAQAGDYTFVDIAHLFMDANQRLESKYTYEGLHLRPEAYPIWVAYLKKLGYL